MRRQERQESVESVNRKNIEKAAGLARSVGRFLTFLSFFLRVFLSKIHQNSVPSARTLRWMGWILFRTMKKRATTGFAGTSLGFRRKH